MAAGRGSVPCRATPGIVLETLLIDMQRPDLAHAIVRDDPRQLLALATNPKTPQGMAMKYVNYLQDKDLRMLMKSKDVPSNVSAHARRILTKKGKV